MGRQGIPRLGRFVELVHSLVDAGTEPTRIAVALVRTMRSAAEIAAARAYLEEAGYGVVDGELPVSTAYGVALDGGRAVTETSYASLNARAEQMA